MGRAYLIDIIRVSWTISALKRNYIIKTLILNTFIVLLAFSSVAHSEIYKWTDENGKVHFSDNKRAVGKSKAETVTINTSLNLIPTLHAQESNPKDKDDVISVSKKKKTKDNKKPVDHRCKLARQIISGEVRLVNGLKTSDHEIKVAKRDIQKYCS